MAEESVETPPTPKRREAGRSHERKSETPPITPKKAVAGRGHERRGSTGMLDSPRSTGSANIPSRYLQTSPSSCHDLCKYGTKHCVEAKPRDSFRKMVTSKGGKMELLDQNSVASAEGKKKLAISPKASSDSRILQKPSNPVVIKEEVSSSTKETDVSVENTGDQKLKSVQSKPFSHPGEGSSSIQRNNEIRISRESPRSGSDSPSPRKGKELRNSKNMGEKKAWVTPTVNLHPKPSTKRVSSMNTRNENNVVKIEPKQPSNEVVPEKTLYIIEASTDQSKCIHSSSSLPSSEKNSLRRTGSGFIAAPPFSSLSLGKKSSRHTGSGSARSPLSLSSSSSFSPYEPSNSKEHGVEKSANAEMEHKSRPRKGGKVSLDFKASPSRKLKFKRAKLVDQLNSDQDSAPRRLKFKRSVRLVGEIQNGKTNARKSGIDNGTKMKSEKDFRRSKDVQVSKRRSYGRKEMGDIENGGKMKSEKVVLKHRNVERKQKDGRSLYNNVIEETARKLVVSRKSKVKALVGAFETVISLQDTREPSVTTMAC
jgi:hypothetical protein